MRVPLSLLQQLAPVELDDTLTVDELARLMNARVSEVEHVHRHAIDLSAFEVVRNTAGRWEARHADGRPATEADLGIGDDTKDPVVLGPDLAAADEAPDLRTALDLDDPVIEFDLEPNRPDLFSLAGMARDACAIWGVDFQELTLAASDWAPLEGISIDVQATELVPRYCALEVSGLQVGPSPQWLQNAVRKLGMRPINNIVDSANLVMLELGEPMHTFDRRQIRSGTIGLRRARQDETITTLDGVERKLNPDILLVTDGDRPVALAGIMGSAESGVQPDTTELIIEAAAFDMGNVRFASRRLGLRTEASLRFEKGLPASGVKPALARLALVLQQVGGPNVTIGGFVDYWPEPEAPRVVSLDPDRVRRRMGMDVPTDRMAEILTVLGCQVRPSEAGLEVVLPDHRPDLRIHEDLEEEVGRIHGYEHVVSALPTAQVAPVTHNPRIQKATQVRDVLSAHGLAEVHLGAWVNAATLETWSLSQDDVVTLKNPLTQDWTTFRPTAWPMVATAVRENRKHFERFGLYEVAQRYRRGADGKVDEQPHLSGAIASPGDDPAGARFYTARDAVLAVCDELGRPVTVDGLKATELPGWMAPHCLHPARAAVILAEGVAIGIVGELHPAMVRTLGLREAPVLFALDLAPLYGHVPALIRYTPPPRFPSVEAHVNVRAPRRLYAADVLAEISAPGLVRSTVRDVWTGAGVGSDEKRLTLELEFNHPDRSLTHEEVAARLKTLKSQIEAGGRLQVEIPA